MGETTGNGEHDAEAAADRLEAALARIAETLAKSPPMLTEPHQSLPGHTDIGTAQAATRLDSLIETVRAELIATGAPSDQTEPDRPDNPDRQDKD
jgi:hypothetical protein